MHLHLPPGSPARPLAVLAAALTLLTTACSKAPEPTTKGPAGTVAAAGKPAPAAPLPKPPTAKYQRDLYGKLEDCLADWALTPRCQPVGTDAPERAQGATFMGPVYSSALRFEAQLSNRREAHEQGYVPQVDENPSNRALATSEVRS